jgi:hypothetical protein
MLWKDYCSIKDDFERIVGYPTKKGVPNLQQRFNSSIVQRFTAGKYVYPFQTFQGSKRFALFQTF